LNTLDQILTKLDHLEKCINGMYSKWQTVKEAAEYCRVSESKLRKLIGSGKIEIHRLDGRILLHRRELDFIILTGSARPTKAVRERLECLL